MTKANQKNPPCTTVSGRGSAERRRFRGSSSPRDRKPYDTEHDESLEGAFWVKTRARFLESSPHAQISQVTHATFNH